jgi:hypothetical protein
MDRHIGETAVSDYWVRWLCRYMVLVCCAVMCQLVVQLYGVGWLCSFIVPGGCAAIFCQLFVLYMVERITVSLPRP